MSEEKPKLIDRVENTARYLKAFACMARSVKTLAIAGVVLAATAIVVPLGYKAYNKVNDIAEMPGEMLSSAKGGLRSAWDHTGGAVIGWFGKDDEAEVIAETAPVEVEATVTEEITPDSVEVTFDGSDIEPQAEEDKGFFRMPSLCVPFVNCNKDVADDAEVDDQLEIEQDPELMQNPELLPAPQ